MKRRGSLSPILILFLLSAFLVPSGLGPTRGASAQEPGPTAEIGSEGSGMPGYPRLAKPIPHHEPGQPSPARSYTTQVQRENELGALEVVEISGVDAMAADGVDPLAGNYTLVNLDKIMMSWKLDDVTSLQTFTSTLSIIDDSTRSLDNYRPNDIAAGDLNGDGQDEQIAAWIDSTNNYAYLSIGEMPGSLGRTTSAPAAVAHAGGSIDLVVRGYDDTLWHRHYNGSSWGAWNNAAGGLLLSGPAIASQGNGSFDVFVIGGDSQIYRRHWDGASWSSQWIKEGESDDWTALDFWFGPTPELAPPAAVARGSHIDLFRLGPDNTLRWFNGSDWESLGGMLASGPGVVSLGPDHMQVFARGVDEALWHRTYYGSWGPWQRLELDGMAEGVTIASAPTAVSPALGQIEVYVRGLDNQLWQSTFDGSSWGSWSSPGGQLASGVAVAAEAWKIIAQKSDGRLQSSANGSDWTSWDGLIPCCATYPTSLVRHINAVDEFEDYSFDVETGYFLGDGRSQIVMAYLSESNPVTPTIALYQIGGGFIPQLVDQVELRHNVDYFSITTGDFLDRDGIDEVALAYVLEQSYGVDIIRLSSGGSGVATEGEPIPDDTRCWDEENLMKFAGTLEVASGDFDADGQDEIAMTVLFDCEDYEFSTLVECRTYRYHARNRIFDVGASYKLSDPYYIEDGWDEEALRRTAEKGVGLAIAAGDVDGDGQDELIRTWPVGFDLSDQCFERDIPRNDLFSRKLQVYELPTAAAWPDGGGRIEGATLFYETDRMGPTFKSYLDRLAVGDLDRDLKGEPVWYLGWDNNCTLRTYDYDVPPTGDPKFEVLAATLPLVSYPDLVTGDFTGEGIRVGPPSYRVQNRVDTLVAHLNMPPKHRDLVKDAAGDYRLIESPEGECSPSPDSPDCTHAKYAAQDFTSSEQTIQTVHAYEISAGNENSACLGGSVEGIAEVKACARTSIDYTHGGNFEKSTEEIESVTFRRKVIAANDDKVVYFGTPYGVWEYPVLAGAAGGPSGDSSEEVFITVAFPLISITQYPDTTGGYYSGTCDETWYAAGHQPNNVWSYDPIGDVTFEDYDPDYELTYDAIEGDWAEGEITYEKLQSAFSSVSFAHSVRAGVEAEVSAEVSIPEVVDISSSIKAYVKGQYSYTGMETDTLTTGQDTTFSYFFAPQPDSGKFTTRVLFYRAKDNYQVLNYQAEPGRAASWQLYDKPDPAFILPWYGFPDPEDPRVPPCGEDQKLFSPDIVITPPHAGLGETVTISATVRNFSNETARNVEVRFYQGDPANNVVIGQRTIPSLSRESGPEMVSIAWTAAGVGQQKIYAVIDPFDDILEMHDEDDLINNNMAYGLVQLAGTAFADMGLVPEQPPYDAISYALGDPRPTVSLYVPRASLDAVARFEVAGTEIGLPVEGRVFQVAAYQGSKYKMWNDPIADFNLKPDADDPPAVIIIAYTQADISALDENILRLYRLVGTYWTEATCPGYQIQRFPAEDLIAVPICQTGIFAFSDVAPGPILPPVAQFSATPLSGAAPLTVAFTDLSSYYPTSWIWDFGDGTTSTAQNPTHTYSEPGSYDVSLTVSNESASNTHTKPNYINAYGMVADFMAAPVRGSAPLTVTFTDLSVGIGTPDPTGWIWDFGDANTSTEQNPTHTYSANGAYTVTLIASNGASSDTKVKPNFITVADITFTYLPLIMQAFTGPQPQKADLIGAFSISPNGPVIAAGDPVLITATVTNQGGASAEAFWVDLFINPASPPRTANTIWSSVCAMTPCFGIAWFVPALEPGQSVTLRSTSDSFASDFTAWPGWLAAGTTDLYLYVDSYGMASPDGAVSESDESNNCAELHGLTVRGINPASTGEIRPVDSSARPSPADR